MNDPKDSRSYFIKKQPLGRCFSCNRTGIEVMDGRCVDCQDEEDVVFA